jgi:xanthine dehydrogenase molybdopterin-binding subunit B
VAGRAPHLALVVRRAERAIDAGGVVRRAQLPRVARLEVQLLSELDRSRVIRECVRRIGGGTGGKREQAKLRHLFVRQQALLRAREVQHADRQRQEQATATGKRSTTS